MVRNLSLRPSRVFPRNIDLYLFLLAAGLSFVMFSLRGNLGLNLADEGYLWYGADHVFKGEVPLRDFQSYAPARYYWCALWFHLWRPGLIPLRFSESVFQIPSLFFGLLAAKRATQNRWALAGIGFLLTLWMYPDYKYFDCAIPPVALFLSFRLAENPTNRRVWFSGLFVGLSSWVGFNHGLYLLLSFSVILFYVAGKTREFKTKALYGSLGIIEGLLPYFFMFLSVKGFWAACLAAIEEIFQKGSNIGLPFPWPWKPFFDPNFQSQALSLFICNLLFLGLPLFYLFGLSKLFLPESQKGWRQYLWICSTVGLPYLHYAFSRADYEHLAVALSPLWIGGLFAVQSKPWRGRLLILALAGSLLSIGQLARFNESWESPPSSMIHYSILDDEIYLSPDTVRQIEGVKKVVQNLQTGENCLIFPHRPTLYCLFQKKSPIWDIYSTFPASTQEQRDILKALDSQNIRWVVIDNEAIPGREDLKFEKTNPLLYQYLLSHYQLVPSYFLPDYYLLFYKSNGSSGKGGTSSTAS